ncbi:MAG TPA: RNA 2',3'-cyclic phosphodiesterase [Clostridia bacterium]|nr:RNA 2',3'-cyclic phosphodiesterase [Clostridia bacterium]
MRLFVGIDIEEPIRKRITQFVDDLRKFAPELRFVGPETYHVTLKFIGETNKLEEIRRALSDVRSAQFPIDFRSYGFFPGAKNPRVFWIGIQAPVALQQLATAVDNVVAPLGFERADSPLSPHLTLARSGSGRPRSLSGDRPNQKFQRIQERLASAPEPEFGTMAAREFFLYESRLSPRGAQYFKVQSYELHP